MLGFAIYFVFVFIETSVSLQNLEDLPDPRIIIVGATGSGKSSLANAFLGCDPMGDECLFEVCSSVNSCTKQTTFGTGMWLGSGQNFTVVDSPGFGDSDQEDDLLIEEMMSVLKNSVGYTNSILLLLNGEETRFNDSLQSMMKLMSSIFGEQWWSFLTVGVSFWSYEQTKIDERNVTCTYYPDKCKDEAWFQREMNSQFQEQFHFTKNFSYVFTDSWSQTLPHKPHQTEQEHWQEETQALWDIITSTEEEFEFKTIDDILHENHDMKEQIKWLNDVITNNISELAASVAQNNVAIEHNGDELSELAASVAQNNVAIEHNGDELSELAASVAQNNVAIEHNGDELSELAASVAQNNVAIEHNGDELSELAASVAQNNVAIEHNGDELSTLATRVSISENGIGIIEDKTIPGVVQNVENEIDILKLELKTLIADVQMDMENMNLAPIGSVTGWLGGKTIQLPTGWQRCDGSSILSGPMSGQKTPDLNTESLFLRGGQPGEAWGIQDDMIKQHQHTVVDPGHKHIDTGHAHDFKDSYNVGENSDDAHDRWVGSDELAEKDKTTTTGKAQISIAMSGISVSQVSGAEAGFETRPKNIAVEWIIKIE